MWDMPVCKLVRLGLVVGAVALSSGCGVLDLDMTSTPDSVRGGDPVTFDFKVTNHSQCPLDSTVVELFPFLSMDDLISELTAGAPADLPAEMVAFLDEVREFFDELCSGGQPDFSDFPSLPAVSMSCSRGEDEIVCRMSGPLGAHAGSSRSMTFAGLGDHLQCEVDGGTVSCQLHLPLVKAAANATGSAAAAVQSLTCLTASQLGFPDEDPAALCFLGTLPNIEGLGPGEMAEGQITLPARGEGFVRNIAIAFTEQDELGVCKGGSEAGKACDPSSQGPCPGSTCGKGICVGGNEGMGCDTATEGADCGAGTCVVCEPADPEMGVLPFACTTTYIAPEQVPAMSPWGLAALAALLFLFGSLWLRWRGRRAAG
jgi:hypothetical protein